MLDRLVTIAYRHRFPIVRKKSFQISLVILVVVYNSIYYLTIPVFKQIVIVQETNYSTYRIACSYGNREQEFIVYLSDFVNITFGNLIVNNILTALTLVQISRSRKRAIHHRRSKRDRKFAVNSIVLNVVMFVFETPVLIILVVNSYRNQESDLLFSIGVLFFTVKCSSSFIVNMITNSIFYSEFMESFVNLRRFGIKCEITP